MTNEGKYKNSADKFLMQNSVKIDSTESSSDHLGIIDYVLDAVISPLIGGLMIIWMAYRLHDLVRLADARIRTLPFSFQFRAFLLFLLSFLYLIALIFTCSTHFLLFDKGYPSAIVTSGLMMIIFIAEVGLLRREFLKSVPYGIGHKIFWMLIFVIAALNCILDFIYLEEVTIMHLTINILKFLDAFLIIYAAIMKPQDLKDHSHLDFFNSGRAPLLPQPISSLLSKKRNNRTTAGENSGAEEQTKVALGIEVRPKVTYKNEEAFYELKVCLNEGERVYKVLRSMKDFIELERNMSKEVHNKSSVFTRSFDEVVCFSSSYFDPKGSLTEPLYSETCLIETLDLYLKKMISYPELLNLHLVLFLEIPEPYKKAVLKSNSRYLQSLIESRNYKPFFREDSSKSSNGENFDILEMEFVQECEEFLTLGLNLLEMPSEKWVITKRKSEILEFLKKYREKSIEDSFLDPRNLKESFRRVCNESRENYSDKSFVGFLGVNERALNMIKIADFEKEKRLLKELNIEIVDCVRVFDKQRQRNRLYYNILVESENRNERKVVFFKNVHKRYRHFKDLHSILLKKFNEKANELPNLPEKPKVYGQQEHCCDIREELQVYLRELIRFPYISQSLAFRRFLNVCFLKGSFIEEPFVEKESHLTFLE